MMKPSTSKPTTSWTDCLGSCWRGKSCLMRTKSPSMQEFLTGELSMTVPAGQSHSGDEFEPSPFDFGEKNELSSSRFFVQLKDGAHKSSEKLLKSNPEHSGKKPEILVPSVISGSFAAVPKNIKLNRYEKFAYLLKKDKSNVTDEQLEIFDRLSSNEDFRKMINKMPYYDIPDCLNYLKLVEEKIKSKDENYQFKDLHAWFVDKKNKEISNMKEVNRLLSAAKTNEINMWSHMLRKAEISNETILKLNFLTKKLVSVKSEQDKMLLMLVNNIVSFKNKMQTTMLEGNISIKKFFDNLPKKWHGMSPWYYTYADKFTGASGQTGFEVLADTLHLIKDLGCNNVYLLPHFESPRGDGGYDISNYEPAKDLGGKEGFRKLVLSAANKGMALMTDLVLGHVSSNHSWFKKALEGEPKYYSYFLKTPRHWKADFSPDKISVVDNDGIEVVKFKDKGQDGEEVETKRIIIFQDFMKTSWLEKPIKGLKETVLMSHTFYPFQIDLNLLNTETLEEIIQVTGNEILAGIPGCRVDAPGALIKKIGGSNLYEPENKTLFEILKTFRDALHPNVVTLPEFPDYKGNAVFEDCSDIRLAAVLGDFQAFFKKQGPDLNLTKKYSGATVIYQNEKHDETSTYEYGEEIQKEFLEKAKNNLDILVYRNNRSYAGRTAPGLGGKPKHEVGYNTLVSFLPGVPSYYYGTELGIKNDYEYVQKYQNEQFELTNKLLDGTGMSVSHEQCLDPRAVQRTSIPVSFMEKKHNSSYASVVSLKELAKIRAKFPVMNSGHCRQILLKSVDGCSTKEVFSIAKIPEHSDQSKSILINLTNMSCHAKTVELCLNDSMQEIRNSRYRVQVESSYIAEGDRLNISSSIPLTFPGNGNIQLKLEPYQATIISLNGDDFYKCFAQEVSVKTGVPLEYGRCRSVT